MDTDSATTPGNNTEDALVEFSPIDAQATPDDDYIQIVPPPPPPPKPVITRSARRPTIVMPKKANRTSNRISLPPPRSNRSALPSQMST